jgi:hypothetical protein
MRASMEAVNMEAVKCLSIVSRLLPKMQAGLHPENP